MRSCIAADCSLESNNSSFSASEAFKPLSTKNCRRALLIYYIAWDSASVVDLQVRCLTASSKTATAAVRMALYFISSKQCIHDSTIFVDASRPRLPGAQWSRNVLMLSSIEICTFHTLLGKLFVRISHSWLACSPASSEEHCISIIIFIEPYLIWLRLALRCKMLGLEGRYQSFECIRLDHQKQWFGIIVIILFHDIRFVHRTQVLQKLVNF